MFQADIPEKILCTILDQVWLGILLHAWLCLITHCQGSTPVSDDAFTLFYGKFRTNAPRVKALIEQIERRVDKNES